MTLQIDCLQVLTQPRDSAPLEDDAFSNEEPFTTQHLSSPSSPTFTAQHLSSPSSPAVQQQPHVEPVQTFTSPVKHVEGSSGLPKKLPRATRPIKGAAAAAQKNDLRKYYPVVKGDAACALRVWSHAFPRK